MIPGQEEIRARWSEFVAAVAYIAWRAGHEFKGEVGAHPNIRQYLRIPSDSIYRRVMSNAHRNRKSVRPRFYGLNEELERRLHALNETRRAAEVISRERMPSAGGRPAAAFPRPMPRLRHEACGVSVARR